MCLATCPQTRVLHRPLSSIRTPQLRQYLKAGQCLQKATLIVEKEDTFFSTPSFVASQNLCQRSVDLISWLGKLEAGPREQASGKLTDGRHGGALWRRQVSADSLCVETWATQLRRDKRDFKEGEDDLRVWLSPRKENRICNFSYSFFLEGKGYSSSSNSLGKSRVERT